MATDDRAPGRIRWLDPVCDAWHLAGLESPAGWAGLLRAAGFAVRRCAAFGGAVLPNVGLLERARLTLTLEAANGGHHPRRLCAWLAQLDALTAAWRAGAFTLGHVFAVRAAADRPDAPRAVAGGARRGERRRGG